MQVFNCNCSLHVANLAFRLARFRGKATRRPLRAQRCDRDDRRQIATSRAGGEGAGQMTATEIANQAAARPEPPHYAGLELDRSAKLRSDEAKLLEMMQQPTSRLLLLSGGSALLVPGSSSSSSSSASGSSASGVEGHQGESGIEGHHHQHHQGEGVQGDAGGGTGSTGIGEEVGNGSSGQQQQQQQQQGYDSGGSSSSCASDPQGDAPKWRPSFVRPAARAMPLLDEKVGLLFLGVDASGAAVFGGQLRDDITHLSAPQLQQLGLPEACSMQAIRKVGPRMAAADAALAAYAVALSQWHPQAAICGRSGSATEPRQGGHARTAVVAAAPGDAAAGGGTQRRPRSTYPRIDPAVIMLVTCRDWALLGRKANWDEGRWSCLAGFAEVGETLEQVVAREVEEEAGVRVDPGSVRYHSSQPWPFPQSLMIGFTAEADPSSVQDPGPGLQWGYSWLEGRDPAAVVAARSVGLKEGEVDAAFRGNLLPAVTPDQDEIEDARFFHREFLEATLLRGVDFPGQSPFRIPQRYALANSIITSWLMERSTGSIGASSMGSMDSMDSMDSAGSMDSMDSSASSGSSASKLAVRQRVIDSVPQVGIDVGVFKYVMMRLTDVRGGSRASRLLVRGSSKAGFHDHILQHTRRQVQRSGLEVQPLGGGRMEHYPEQRLVQVYGYSSAFGPACHDVTAQLLARALPFYDKENIVVSYEGY